MLPEIKKILYATDLSPNSAYAFRYASAAARRHGARVILLHVMEKLSPTAESLVAAYLNPESREAVKERKKADLVEHIHRKLDGYYRS